MKSWGCLLVCVLGSQTLACGGDDKPAQTHENTRPDSGIADAGANKPKDAGNDSEPAKPDAAKPPARDEDAGDMKSADASRPAPKDAGDTTKPADMLVPLPNGGREVDGIVNLVDEAAESQLEQYILQPIDAMPTRAPNRHGLTLAANAFLSAYPEQYDFLYFITDHVLSGGSVIAKYEAVNRRAQPGGTLNTEVQASGYRTEGRLQGVIGIRYRPGIYPPVAHETLHHWANYLDPSFGFGETPGDPHWGLASVHGVLGGFDQASVHCETPANAVPPACTALQSGKTRYVVGGFFANDNSGFGIPYAPLELYLMGLAPRSDVPNNFQIFDSGAIDESTRGNDTVVVEASGMKSVDFSAIVARHGEVPQLPKDQRAFKAAFVVVSAKPASDDVLHEVANWAAVFGGRVKMNGWASFQSCARDLAQMDTQLGKRRLTTDKVPDERGELRCDLLKQDCPRSELGCYERSPTLCALSGGIARDQTCDQEFACAPGLECMANASNVSTCQPYCDPSSTTSDKACTKMCTGDWFNLTDKDNKTIGGVCAPP